MHCFMKQKWTFKQAADEIVLYLQRAGWRWLRHFLYPPTVGCRIRRERWFSQMRNPIYLYLQHTQKMFDPRSEEETLRPPKLFKISLYYMCVQKVSAEFYMYAALAFIQQLYLGIISYKWVSIKPEVCWDDLWKCWLTARQQTVCIPSILLT